MVYKNGQIAFEKLASLAFIQRPTKRAATVLKVKSKNLL
jgi:hypothetical protein